MLLRDVMSTTVEEISPEATLREAAAKMKLRNVGLLPVVENDHVVGMITDRDIVVRAVAKGRNPSESIVRAAMTTNVIFCFDDDDVDTAASVMSRGQVRRLLILDHNQHPVGIIALGDLATRLRDEELSGNVLEQISEPAHAGTQPLGDIRALAR